MTVTILPSAPSGSVAAPPSKSMAHRLLLCAGLTIGESIVRGLAPSEDVLATVDCLRALGVRCVRRGGDVVVSGYTLHCGTEGATLPCRESASTLRFFLPLCLFGPPITLTGSRRLLARPLEAYRTLCEKQGIRFEKGEEAVTVEGTLRPGEFRLPGDVSSQFVSGLLFALPGLDGDSVIRLRPPVVSRSYIDMTMAALRRFGVETRWTDRESIAVPGRQYYHFVSEATVEGDWSNAAPFLALGVSVTGLDGNSLQGDKVCAEYFRLLDAGRPTLDVTDCPDLAPLLMAYAAMRSGAALTGTRRLRWKESDRGWAMAEELEKFGVRVQIGADSITVEGGLRSPTAPLDGHGDHRIVMALSVLCVQTGGVIKGAEAVDKSFPDFFEKLQSAGVGMRFDRRERKQTT